MEYKFENKYPNSQVIFQTPATKREFIDYMFKILVSLETEFSISMIPELIKLIEALEWAPQKAIEHKIEFNGKTIYVLTSQNLDAFGVLQRGGTITSFIKTNYTSTSIRSLQHFFFETRIKIPPLEGARGRTKVFST